MNQLKICLSFQEQTILFLGGGSEQHLETLPAWSSQVRETICPLLVSDQERSEQGGGAQPGLGSQAPLCAGLTLDSAVSSCHLACSPGCCTCSFLCLDSSVSRSSHDREVQVHIVLYRVQIHCKYPFLREAFLDYSGENVPLPLQGPSNSLSSW